MEKKAVTEMMPIMLLMCMLALTFRVQPVRAAHVWAVDWWPMFHHDLSHLGYSTSTAPNTNNTVWNCTTGGPVYSCPAVAEGEVYVGSNDFRVYCFNASTGAHIWNYSTDDAESSSPAVADGRVYVGSNDFRVYCLNATTGGFIWSYTTGAAVYSSPAVADGRVYVGSYDHKVYCFDAVTGVHIWNYTTGGEVLSSPAVADGRVYVGSNDFVVYCLNATTGGFIWSYTTGAAVYSCPAVAEGEVYVGSLDGNGVYCLNATTGTRKWNSTGFSVRSSPAVADGKVYVGSMDFRVYCFNASTGAHIWNYTTGSEVLSSPAVADGKVYVGSSDDKVYVFGTRARLAWSTDSAGNSKTTFDLMDNIYVRGQGFTADIGVTIYLVPDGAEALPANAVTNGSTTINSAGDLTVTLVWSQPLTLGNYDIWVDVNQNGMFDGGDVWNSQSIGIYGFDVIPEFHIWTLTLLIFITLTVAIATYKRRLFKTSMH